jgi:hypothetical protein
MTLRLKIPDRVLQLVVVGSQPHRTTEYWLDQRAQAIVTAVQAAGLDRPRGQS